MTTDQSSGSEANSRLVFRYHAIPERGRFHLPFIASSAVSCVWSPPATASFRCTSCALMISSAVLRWSSRSHGRPVAYVSLSSWVSLPFSGRAINAPAIRFRGNRGRQRARPALRRGRDDQSLEADQCVLRSSWAGRSGCTHPSWRATPSAASFADWMSSFFMVNMACMARLARSGSGSPSNEGSSVGTICQRRPKRSFSHPQAISSPPSVSAPSSGRPPRQWRNRP